MGTIPELPEDLRGFSPASLKAAREERRERLASFFERAPNSITAVEVKEIKRLNDELERLNEPKGLQEHPGHHVGPGQRSTGSDNRLKFGRVDGLGSEFVKQMGEKALDGTTGGATMPGSFFDPRLRELPHRKLFVRSLIPTTRVNSDKVAYIRQTVLTNNAAAVAAGALKPTSVITAAREEAPIRVIAHISEALDRSMLSDYDQLIRFIDDQLRLGVLLEEERQILLGSGVAPNLTGILTTVGIQTQAKGADPVPDAVHKAITKVRNVFGAGCRRDASE